MLSMTATWREQYDRMRRFYARVSESTTVDDRLVDDFHAFCIFSYHLKDWLQADLSVDAQIRNRVEEFVSGNLWLGLCADLANGSKHLILDRTPRFEPQVHMEIRTLEFDTAGFSPEAFLEQKVMVIPVNGQDLLALRAAQRIVATWHSFLTECGLLDKTP